MNQFLLSVGGGTKPNLPLFGKMNNLRAIHKRNVERFKSFYGMGNRVLPNQHPLVQFLLQLSIDPKWTPNELYDNIVMSSKKIASNVGITSLYNRGKNHSLSLYPEENHHTLLVMPFDKDLNGKWEPDNEGTVRTNTTAALTPLMTTSKTHYWNIDHLIDGVVRKAPEDVYSVLELDPFALAFGFYWYLKERIKNNINVGLTPHHYVILVLMEAYIAHNNLTVLNLITDNENVVVQSSGFAMESYNHLQNEHTGWARTTLLSERIKTSGEWVSLCGNCFYDIDNRKSVFSQRSDSVMFVQLGWVYTLCSLYWASSYLFFMDFMGSFDPMVTSKLKTFYKIPMNFNTNQIKDPYWNSFYINVWKNLN
ncbi:hypothetical protein [Aeromonas phage AerS_266]|nr:hypothetical protein [Aeromonas phage AerS_266]